MTEPKVLTRESLYESENMTKADGLKQKYEKKEMYQEPMKLNEVSGIINLKCNFIVYCTFLFTGIVQNYSVVDELEGY